MDQWIDRGENGEEKFYGESAMEELSQSHRGGVVSCWDHRKDDIDNDEDYNMKILSQPRNV